MFLAYNKENKKKIFSFSQKHVPKNTEFLSEYLKAKTKFKNMKSQECYEKLLGKEVYLHLFLFFILMFLFFLSFIYFLVEKVQSSHGFPP